MRLGFDPVPSQRGGGKVLQVLGHDDIGPAVNRSRQDVPVMGIGQGERRNQFVKARHQRIAHVEIHQVADPGQLVPRQVGTILQDAADSFLVNPLGPAYTEQVRQCQVHQQAAEFRRRQHAGIEQGGEVRHAQ